MDKLLLVSFEDQLTVADISQKWSLGLKEVAEIHGK